MHKGIFSDEDVEDIPILSEVHQYMKRVQPLDAQIFNRGDCHAETAILNEFNMEAALKAKKKKLADAITEVIKHFNENMTFDKEHYLC